MFYIHLPSRNECHFLGTSLRSSSFNYTICHWARIESLLPPLSSPSQEHLPARLLGGQPGRGRSGRVLQAGLHRQRQGAEAVLQVQDGGRAGTKGKA